MDALESQLIIVVTVSSVSDTILSKPVMPSIANTFFIVSVALPIRDVRIFSTLCTTLAAIDSMSSCSYFFNKFSAASIILSLNPIGMPNDVNRVSLALEGMALRSSMIVLSDFLNAVSKSAVLTSFPAISDAYCSKIVSMARTGFLNKSTHVIADPSIGEVILKKFLPISLATIF